jgi:hypothetical protein
MGSLLSRSLLNYNFYIEEVPILTASKGSLKSGPFLFNWLQRNIMKPLLVVVCSLGLVITGYGQLKEVPVSRIIKLKVNELKCLDSNSVVTNICSLGLDGISVEFYKVFLDEKESEIRIIGRCGAIAGIDIFKAVKKENKLYKITLLGETSYDKKYINNDGFFDIVMKVDKNESLFFHETRYFLVEYSVFKLFQN